MKKIVCMAIPSADAKAPFQKRVRKIIAKQSESVAPASFSNSLIKSDNFSRFFFKFRLKSIFHSASKCRAKLRSSESLILTQLLDDFCIFSKLKKRGFKWPIFPNSILGSSVFLNSFFREFQIFKFSNFLFFQIFRTR